MPETMAAINALAAEMRSGFAGVGLRVTAVENELHRHQDEDRADMGAIRSDIRVATLAQATLDGKIQGSIAMLRWFLGIPAFIAATGTVIGLIRHW